MELSTVVHAQPSSASTQVATVCIAIPTYRRPDDLRALLRAIAKLESSPYGIVKKVAVFDNDAEQSALAIFQEVLPEYDVALEYHAVPEPGLSAVRNAMLAYAENQFDLMVMIDDDEIPVPNWLAELLRIYHETRADVVIGPVPRYVPPECPPWIARSRAFTLPTFPDGCLIHDGYSGNCLMKVETIQRMGLRFDPALNTAGGEDQFFFRQLLVQGGRIAFAAHAIASELVPLARTQLSFLLRRSMRKGNTLSFCDRRLYGLSPMLALRALKGGGLVGLGMLLFVPYAARQGRTGMLQSLLDITRGIGMLSGLFGFLVIEYARPPKPKDMSQKQ